ncbi:Fe-S protein assembly co-chaperone HscB [Plasmodium fragile]|uniref:Fe-S protein assembly co-chaperone HscB n=1 Tax=Plasmodium fragile TaxID=5857 RepID=A0A0D9QPB0_PLAFR|nr:Fe-S protein assembly co-chaperone HscB [Plasmodium fragile]KJP88602.1 Fe-S protein assembly co-chaperone HscB [Plasmodium fragile]
MNKVKYVSLLWRHKVVFNTAGHRRYHRHAATLEKKFYSSGKYTSTVKRVKCHNCHRDICLDVVPLSCQTCSALLHVDAFKQFNFFELFGLRATYDIDKGHLKEKFNNIQKLYHPDKHAQNEQREQINEVSSYLNSAYKTLQNDVDRALYLLNIQYNYKIPEEENLEDSEFLAEIIEVNEQIGDPEANITLMTKQYKDKYQDHVEKIKLHFDTGVNNKYGYFASPTCADLHETDLAHLGVNANVKGVPLDFEHILKALKKLKFINRILDRLQNV